MWSAERSVFFPWFPPDAHVMSPFPQSQSLLGCETDYMLGASGCGIESTQERLRCITTELGTEKIRATMLVLKMTDKYEPTLMLASVIAS